MTRLKILRCPWCSGALMEDTWDDELWTCLLCARSFQRCNLQPVIPKVGAPIEREGRRSA